jgi:hypothetical protein
MHLDGRTVRDADVLKGPKRRLDGLALAGLGGEELEGVAEVGGDVNLCARGKMG